MTEAELLARHPVAAQPGGEPFFARDAARAVAEDAAADALAVLGVEGVRLLDGKTIPDLRAILDLSGGLRLPWREAVRASREDALGFLGRQPPDLLFSIVFASEGEFD